MEYWNRIEVRYMCDEVRVKVRLGMKMSKKKKKDV